MFIPLMVMEWHKARYHLTGKEWKAKQYPEGELPMAPLARDTFDEKARRIRIMKGLPTMKDRAPLNNGFPEGMKIPYVFWVSAVFAAIYCLCITDHGDWYFLGFHNPNFPGWLLAITFVLGLPITFPVAIEKGLGAGLGIALAMIIVYVWAWGRAWSRNNKT